MVADSAEPYFPPPFFLLESFGDEASRLAWSRAVFALWASAFPEEFFFGFLSPIGFPVVG